MSDAPDLLDWQPPTPRGDTFDADRDGARLADQARRVLAATLDLGWLTLAEISAAALAPEASVSARLRDLRASGFVVDRKYIRRGLCRYRVTRAAGSNPA